MSVFEKMCADANSKWLMGTDEITQLDIHCGAMWEITYLMDDLSIYTDVRDKLKIRENAPNWVAYMEKFRSHPVLKE